MKSFYYKYKKIRNHLASQEWVNAIYDYCFMIKVANPFNRFPLTSGIEHDRCFFIIGSGRSGNTLVRRVLTSSERIHIPPETYVLGTAIKTFMRLSWLSWPDVCMAVFAHFVFHPEFETFMAPDISVFMNQVLNLPKDKRTLANALSIFYRWHAWVEGKTEIFAWGDKTPLNVFSLWSINKVFPNAKYIFMTRDPFDVVNSYINTGLYKSYEKAAIRWVSANKACLSFEKKASNRVLRMSYENFCRQPQEQTKKICNFLGIRFEGKMLDPNTTEHRLGDVGIREHHARVLRAIDLESIGKGKTEIKPRHMELVNRLCSPVAARLGY